MLLLPKSWCGGSTATKLATGQISTDRMGYASKFTPTPRPLDSQCIQLKITYGQRYV